MVHILALKRKIEAEVFEARKKLTVSFHWPVLLKNSFEFEIYQNDYFPNELLVHIFSFLDMDDLKICSMVCKKWHEASELDSLWKAFIPSFHSKFISLESNFSWNSKTKVKTQIFNYFKETSSFLQIQNTCPLCDSQGSACTCSNCENEGCFECFEYCESCDAYYCSNCVLVWDHPKRKENTGIVCLNC